MLQWYNIYLPTLVCTVQQCTNTWCKVHHHKSVFVSIVLWTCICIAASQLSVLAMIGSHFTSETLAKPAQTSAKQNTPTAHYILICLMSGFVNKQKVIKSMILLRARCLVKHQRLAELLSPCTLSLESNRCSAATLFSKMHLPTPSVDSFRCCMLLTNQWINRM